MPKKVPTPCKWRGKCKFNLKKVCAYSHVVHSNKEIVSEKYDDTIEALKRETFELKKRHTSFKREKSEA